MARKHDKAFAEKLRETICKDDRSLFTVAEIGVFRGEMSRFLLNQFPKMFLHMVDIWRAVSPDSQYGKSESSARKATDLNKQKQLKTAMDSTSHHANRRILHVGMSIDVGAYMKNDSLDAVFIDGDHTERGVLDDLLSWYHKVRPGGLIAGHDIDVKERPEWQVRRAVERFRASRGITTPLTTGPGTTWFFQKPE